MDIDPLFKSFIDGLIEQAPKDWSDGFGTIYERYKINELYKRYIDKYDIESVLEGPSDGLTGVRGVGSLIFALNDIPVTFCTPSKEEVKLVETAWKKIEKNVGKKLPHKIVLTDQFLTNIPDNSHDLVWNFCIFEHFENPTPLLKSMKRIAKRIIIIQNQNIWNVGTIPHIIYHKLVGQPWNHGDLKYMRLSVIEDMMKKEGIKVLEKRLIDVPPWPDTWDTPVRWIFKRLSNMRGRNKGWRWSVVDCPDLSKYEKAVKRVSFLEDANIPNALKLPFTHHGLIMGKK